jgi:hypothetical protein
LRRPIEPGELCAVVASANCGAPHAMRGSELPVRPHRGLRLAGTTKDTTGAVPGNPRCDASDSSIVSKVGPQ